MARQAAKEAVDRSSEAPATPDSACARRSRAEVAAKAATEKKWADETPGGKRNRRKRTKTCEKKLSELGEMTDTLALFGYYDPKTNEWHGSVHIPDGQQIPADIYDKVSLAHGITSRTWLR